MKKNKANRTRIVQRRGKKSGLPPGTAVFVGERKQRDVQISLMCYDALGFEEIAQAALDDCRAARDNGRICWININGIHEVDTLKQIAALFGLHPLTTEDIANTHQRPKAEEFEGYVFFTLKMLGYDEASHAIVNENVSLILGDRYVVSFQEREGDVLDPLRQRLRTSRGRIRSEGADYLAYAIMDSIVDNYFVTLEKFADHIEELDEAILTAPDRRHMHELHRLKREVVFLRKAVWPLREKLSTIERLQSRHISDPVRPFLRDLYDHSIQIIDMVESYRDIIGSMHDTFLSSISNRMNEVMKVLTMIGTIFIPLTFIAGIYGMNFHHMPELEWAWGYFIVLGVMAAIALVMLGVFRKRKWF